MCHFNDDFDAYEIETYAGTVHVHQDGSVVLFRPGGGEGVVVFDANPTLTRLRLIRPVVSDDPGNADSL